MIAVVPIGDVIIAIAIACIVLIVFALIDGEQRR